MKSTDHGPAQYQYSGDILYILSRPPLHMTRMPTTPVTASDELLVCQQCHSPYGDRVAMDRERERERESRGKQRRRPRFCVSCHGSCEFTPTLVKYNLNCSVGRLGESKATGTVSILDGRTDVSFSPGKDTRFINGYHTPLSGNPQQINADSPNICKMVSVDDNCNVQMNLLAALDSVVGMGDEDGENTMAAYPSNPTFSSSQTSSAYFDPPSDLISGKTATTTTLKCDKIEVNNNGESLTSDRQDRQSVLTQTTGHTTDGEEECNKNQDAMVSCRDKPATIEGEGILGNVPCLDSTDIKQCSECGVLCDSHTHGVHYTHNTYRDTHVHTHNYVTQERGKAMISLENIDEYEQRLRKQQDIMMDLLLQRKEYFHKSIDRWYNKITVELETALAKELDNLKQEKANITAHINKIADFVHSLDHTLNTTPNHVDTEEAVVEEVSCSDMYTARQHMQLCLGAAPGISREVLGQLSIRKVRDSPRNALKPATPTGAAATTSTTPLLISCARELSNFESRSGEESDYQASSISVTPTDQIIVTDIGMESVKVFSSNCSSNHRLVCCLNILSEDQPTAAVMLPNGKVAVACQTEVKLYQIQDMTGVYLHSLWDGFDCPQCVKLHQGELLVSEFTSLEKRIHTKNRETIYVFDAESGEKVDRITWSESQFSHRAPLVSRARYFTPCNSGDIIVSDHDDHTLKVISPQGEVRQVIGGQGIAAGQFFLPGGVCVDHLGNIVVADSGNHRVQVLSPQGEPLAIVVNQEEHGLCWPTDVAVNSKGHLVVLEGDGKVRTFKYIFSS